MAVSARLFPDLQSLDGAAIRASLHTGDHVQVQGGGATINGCVIGDATWTTLEGVQLSDAAVRFLYGDPYDLQHDLTPGGKGDPLAEVRGLSYDETLRAIDRALNAE